MKDSEILWWNGGGGIATRIGANPVLQTLLGTKPDIFVYGEALVYKVAQTPAIPGYNVILHKAKMNSHRRGLAVYFRKELSQVLSKDNSSKTYDIIWIRWKTCEKERILCFFYSPGSHHEEVKREKFYDDLRDGMDNYLKNTTVYMIGDSNARLGAFTEDRDIHGNLKSNKNKPLFLGFLNYSGMYLINNMYARGQPTYEKAEHKRSIIDFCLTNRLTDIKSFEVLPQILGASAQTSHKVLKLIVTTKTEQIRQTEAKKKKFRHCNNNALRMIKGDVARRIRLLTIIRGKSKDNIYKYDVLRRLYRNAKKRVIGYKRPQHRWITTSLSVKTMQEKIRLTNAKIRRGGRDVRLLVNTLTNQENQL